MTRDTSVLGMMMKFWDVGAVKTRLGAAIGMRPAASLQREFCRHLCATLARSADRRVLVVSPDDSQDRLRQALCQWSLEDRWQVAPQGDGDLGSRIERWFRYSLACDGRSVLIGADCPLLDHAHLQSASRVLDDHDAVIGPAHDGGYYLIGLRGPWQDHWKELFAGISWGGREVARQTFRRIDATGLSVGRLEPMDDIDTEVELNTLRRRLNTQPSESLRLRTAIDAILGEPVDRGEPEG